MITADRVCHWLAGTFSAVARRPRLSRSRSGTNASLSRPPAGMGEQQAGHGSPAPQPHAPCTQGLLLYAAVRQQRGPHGRSGWFSQTAPVSAHWGHTGAAAGACSGTIASPPWSISPTEIVGTLGDGLTTFGGLLGHVVVDPDHPTPAFDPAVVVRLHVTRARVETRQRPPIPIGERFTPRVDLDQAE